MTAVGVGEAIDFRVRPPMPEFKRSPRRVDALSSRTGIAVPRSFQEMSLEMLFEEMAEAGVGQIVTPARSAPMGVVPNDFVSEFEKKYPDKIIGFGAVDPMGILHDPVAEVHRCVKELGLHGIYVEPGLCLQRPDAHDARITGEAKAGLLMDDARMIPIYAACSELGVPVMPDTGPLNGKDFTYTDPIQIDNVAGIFPNLKIVCAHACWPYATEIIAVAFKRPNVYVQLDKALDLPGSTPYIEAMLHPVLQRQVLWGSSYPNQPIGERMDALKKLPIPESAKRLVTVDNPRRVLES